MWTLIGGMSLALCATPAADDPAAKPSVLVECSGRMRHGVVAIGGETTGTTITFNRTTWELQLHDEASRKFVQEHHKKSVVVIGALRKVPGVERKDRWIIDVKTMADGDGENFKQGTRIRVHGMLQLAGTGPNKGSRMTVISVGNVWPLDLSADPRLQSGADELVGHHVLLMGDLKPATNKDSAVRSFAVHVKHLKRSDNPPPRTQHE